jgi:ArsR family transcriptional regulator
MNQILPIADCADRLKLLADETRLSVIRQLLKGPRRVGEINESLGLEPSLLSHHLKILRDAGLVQSQREGKAVLYQLSPEVKVKPGGEGINLGCCLLSFE